MSIIKGGQESLAELGLDPHNVTRAVASNILSEASNHETVLNRIRIACGLRVGPIDDGEMTRLVDRTLRPPVWFRLREVRCPPLPNHNGAFRLTDYPRIIRPKPLGGPPATEETSGQGPAAQLVSFNYRHKKLSNPAFDCKMLSDSLCVPCP